MNSKEKIEYMWDKILEGARLYKHIFPVDCSSVRMNNGEIFPFEEQTAILEKFQEEKKIEIEIFSYNARDPYHIPIILLDKKALENPEIELRVKGGILIVNTETGFVKLNNTEHTYNLGNKQFQVLLKLLNSKNNFATYDELLEKENAPKTMRKSVVDVFNNLKRNLQILPASNPKNEDIFDNITGRGYKIIKK